MNLGNWNWMMNTDVFPLRNWWPLFILIVVLEIVLKGVALYRSARNGDKYWFVAILIINTVGILPLVYLIWFANRKSPAPVRSPSSPPRSRRGRRKK